MKINACETKKAMKTYSAYICLKEYFHMCIFLKIVMFYCRKYNRTIVIIIKFHMNTVVLNYSQLNYFKHPNSFKQLSSAGKPFTASISFTPFINPLGDFKEINRTTSNPLENGMMFLDPTEPELFVPKKKQLIVFPFDVVLWT